MIILALTSSAVPATDLAALSRITPVDMCLWKLDLMQTLMIGCMVVAKTVVRF